MIWYSLKEAITYEYLNFFILPQGIKCTKYLVYKTKIIYLLLFQ